MHWCLRGGPVAKVWVGAHSCIWVFGRLPVLQAILDVLLRLQMTLD